MLIHIVVGFLGEPPLRDEVVDVLTEDGLIVGDGKFVGKDGRVGGDVVAHVLVLDLGEVWHALDDDGAPAEGLVRCVMSCTVRPCPLFETGQVKLTNIVDIGQLGAIFKAR